VADIGGTARAAVRGARAAVRGARAAVRGAGAAGPAGSGCVFLYGVTDDPSHASLIQAVGSTGAAVAPEVAAVRTGLSATPVLSPDGSLLGLSAVTMTAGEARVTVSIVETTTGTIARSALLTIPGVPADAGILVTPAFAPDSSLVTLVIATTVKTSRRVVSKRDPRTGGTIQVEAGQLRSQHALAYLDLGTGSLAGPFFLGDEGTLALSTAVATDKELFLWTTMDPQALHLTKGYKRAVPLPSISVYPYGSRQARLTVPTAGPWPSSEPAVALPDGDAARLVNARTIQVVSARNGDLSEFALPPLSRTLARPTPATMTVRPDGTVFLTKVRAGRAAIADPARGFTVTRDLQFPVPDRSSAGPLSQAALSGAGDRLYVLGAAATGGLSSYDMATGALVAAYANGTHYTGVYLLPGGELLAVSAANPRLSYFSPELELLGLADTSISIAAVY
jgi:hypothetical protein